MYAVVIVLERAIHNSMCSNALNMAHAHRITSMTLTFFTGSYRGLVVSMITSTKTAVTCLVRFDTHCISYSTVTV